MENILGHRLAGVRFRQDENVTALDLDAVTTGSNIVFAPGEYRPGSSSGADRS